MRKKIKEKQCYAVIGWMFDQQSLKEKIFITIALTSPSVAAARYVSYIHIEIISESQAS